MLKKLNLLDSFGMQYAINYYPRSSQLPFTAQGTKMNQMISYVVGIYYLIVMHTYEGHFKMSLAQGLRMLHREEDA
jgi:hypothetical protein